MKSHATISHVRGPLEATGLILPAPIATKQIEDTKTDDDTANVTRTRLTAQYPTLSRDYAPNQDRPYGPSTVSSCDLGGMQIRSRISCNPRGAQNGTSLRIRHTDTEPARDLPYGQQRPNGSSAVSGLNPGVPRT